MDLTATQEDLRVTNARLKAAEQEHAAVGQELQVGAGGEDSRGLRGPLGLLAAAESCHGVVGSAGWAWLLAACECTSGKKCDQRMLGIVQAGCARCIMLSCISSTPSWPLLVKTLIVHSYM
jgi:hypothetical protein